MIGTSSRAVWKLSRVALKQIQPSRFKAAAAAVKPFFYQDIFEPEQSVPTPWKKLSGNYKTEIVATFVKIFNCIST